MPLLSQTVSSFALSNAWRNMVSLRAQHHWANMLISILGLKTISRRVLWAFRITCSLEGTFRFLTHLVLVITVACSNMKQCFFAIHLEIYQFNQIQRILYPPFVGFKQLRELILVYCKGISFKLRACDPILIEALFQILSILSAATPCTSETVDSFPTFQTSLRSCSTNN